MKSSLLFAGLLALFSQAEAAIVHVNGLNQVTAIEGVIIGGGQYDVCFDNSFANDAVFPQTLAMEGVETIAQLLNEFGSGGDPNTQFSHLANSPGIVFLIPYAVITPEVGEFAVALLGAGWHTSGPFIGNIDSPTYMNIRTVPEPSAVLLSTAGLLLTARRRR